MTKHTSSRKQRLSRSLQTAGVLATVLSSLAPLHAQKTTGGIEGTVTDSSGAVVPNARVLATDETTGEKIEATSDAQGFYRLLEVHPDSYLVTVEAQGFKQASVPHLLVLISRVNSLNVTLSAGSTSEQVTVSSGTATDLDTVSTESGEVITQKQIEQLPIVGRNAMDLAQLSPGVQLRDGNDIDPTKNNFTIAAFQGRSGRETQVQLDGLSLQDHTVGGPVQNTGLDAVQEFQVAQSTLNPAQSVASGGAVNILTRSGSNDLHGSAFEFFRDSRLGAKIGPELSPYDRNQIGGHLGGAFVRDRLFYFLDYELTDSRDSFYADTIFPSLNGFYGKPFRENYALGRLDAVLSDRWKAFARYSYSPNHGVVGYPELGSTYLDSLDNKTQAIVFGGGASYAGSRGSHSFAYGFNSYSERLLPNPQAPAPADTLGRKYLIQIDGGSTLAYGVNWLSSQYEKQHTHDGKYDGVLELGRHTLSFGTDLTHWLLGTDYPLRENSPELDTDSYLGPGLTDPTQFPLTSISLGNGLGFYTVPGALGFPHGAFPEWRPAAYIHDAWKVSRQLTINAGVRYVFFSGQFDPGVDHGTAIDAFKPGYGGYRHNPKTDFAPQVGVAWDVHGDGKTVIRSAAGLYYEELTLDGFYGDPSDFIPAGISSQMQTVTAGSALIDPRNGLAFKAGDPLATQYGFPNGTSGAALAPLFGETIGEASTGINNLNELYVAAAALNTSTDSTFALNNALYVPAWAPGTKNPRVAQANVAYQRQLRKGLVFTGEYVYVHGYEFPLVVDENHVGSATAATFDPVLAAAAIAATNSSLGCPASLAGTTCAINQGATIATYGASGLGAGTSQNGYAFRGLNPNFGPMNFYEHRGLNTYNGLNLRLDGRFGAPDSGMFRWMNGNTVTFAYTLSRNVGNLRTSGTGAADVSASPTSWDNVAPNRFVGPDGLDRTSILNLGTITDIKRGFTFSQITHWFSPLSNNALLPVAFGGGCGGGPEEIFCTDVTGDGTVNDLLPGYEPGAFGRSLKAGKNLNTAIANYNSTMAGQLTPAGNLLVSQGLMTSAQLQQLKAGLPTLPLAPPNQLGLDLLLHNDVRIEYSHNILGDRLAVQTSWDVFNIFNRSSYDAPENLLNGNLSGAPESINGTTAANRTNIRQRGSGTFEQGSRRQMQAGLRLTF